MKFLSLRLLLPAACLPFFTISASLSQTLLVTGKPVMETTVKALTQDVETAKGHLDRLKDSKAHATKTQDQGTQGSELRL